MALVHFHPWFCTFEVVFGGQRFFSKTSDEKLKNWRVSWKWAYLLSCFRRISFFSWFFLLGKLMLQRPVMGISFNEVELKNNLIGYIKVTIFYSRQWKIGN
jgi:hypothetical protein